MTKSDTWVLRDSFFMLKQTLSKAVSLNHNVALIPATIMIILKITMWWRINSLLSRSRQPINRTINDFNWTKVSGRIRRHVQIVQCITSCFISARPSRQHCDKVWNSTSTPTFNSKVLGRLRQHYFQPELSPWAHNQIPKSPNQGVVVGVRVAR